MAAIVIDVASGFVAGRDKGWYVRGARFAERHGLILIIALGESVIVAASAIVYSYMHFPLICDIIGLAVGFEQILAHPCSKRVMPTAQPDRGVSLRVQA